MEGGDCRIGVGASRGAGKSRGEEEAPGEVRGGTCPADVSLHHHLVADAGEV